MLKFTSPKVKYTYLIVYVIQVCFVLVAFCLLQFEYLPSKVPPLQMYVCRGVNFLCGMFKFCISIFSRSKRLTLFHLELTLLYEKKYLSPNIWDIQTFNKGVYVIWSKCAGYNYKSCNIYTKLNPVQIHIMQSIFSTKISFIVHNIFIKV